MEGGAEREADCERDVYGCVRAGREGRGLLLWRMSFLIYTITCLLDFLYIVIILVSFVLIKLCCVGLCCYVFAVWIPYAVSTHPPDVSSVPD